MDLSDKEVRVLGALMEKARTTPDIYPMTLNSLVNACNQKTSRDPVTDYDEEEVQGTLDDLREKGLVMRVDMAGSRTAKYRETASERWQLARQEYALLATLFLRGPQTPGQLRQRCERLYPFADLSQVSDWLHQMQQREEEPHSLVTALERTPGTKEIRYAQILSPLPAGEAGDAAGGMEKPFPTGGISRTAGTANATPAGLITPAPGFEDRLAELERRVAELEDLLNSLTS